MLIANSTQELVGINYLITVITLLWGSTRLKRPYLSRTTFKNLGAGTPSCTTPPHLTNVSHMKVK